MFISRTHNEAAEEKLRKAPKTHLISASPELKFRQPDGQAREDGRGIYIYRESAPELRFLWLNGEWSDEENRDVFRLDPGRRDCAGSLGYGGDWDENGFNMDGFPPAFGGRNRIRTLRLGRSLRLSPSLHIRFAGI